MKCFATMPSISENLADTLTNCRSLGERIKIKFSSSRSNFASGLIASDIISIPFCVKGLPQIPQISPDVVPLHRQHLPELRGSDRDVTLDLIFSFIGALHLSHQSSPSNAALQFQHLLSSVGTISLGSEVFRTVSQSRSSLSSDLNLKESDFLSSLDVSSFSVVSTDSC